MSFLYIRLPQISTRSEDLQRWMYCKGVDDVRRWGVNDRSNDMRVLGSDGRTLQFHLKQFDFEAGDFIRESLLPLAQARLLVTHNQGAYIVNKHGQVLRELQVRKIKCVEFHGGSGKTVTNPNPLDFVDFVAKASNGRTILGVGNDADQSIIVLGEDLYRETVYCAPWARLESIHEQKGGWTIILREGNKGYRFFLGDEGDYKASKVRYQQEL